MARQLDYRRGGRPVRRWARWQRRLTAVVAAAALALGVWLGGPWLAAQALAAPQRLQRWAAPALAARMEALRQENFALRTRLAALAGLAAENEALRALAGSPARPADAVCRPARVTARGPGTLTLYCAQGLPAVGDAVLDRTGHYAGRVTAADGHAATIELGGSPACLAGSAAGVLETGPDGWRLTGLALPVQLAADTVVTTPDGYWVGTVAGAAVPDAGGLTAHVPLTDTAFLSDCLYFVATG